MTKPIVYAPITTGTTKARDIRDRFADVVNVKDFGAVGDGTTDDSAAFIAAYNAITTSTPSSKSIYVPAGTYYLSNASNIDTFNTKNIFKLCEGHGVIHLSNGAWRPLKTPGNEDRMASRIVTQFSASGGAVQSLCALDDYIFTAHGPDDGLMYIKQFVMGNESTSRATINLSDETLSNPEPLQARVTVEFSGVGGGHCGMIHAVWANSQKTQATIYINNGSTFCVISWDNTTPSNSTIVSQENTAQYFYRSEGHNKACISPDGKWIAFLGRRYISGNDKPSSWGFVAPTWSITIYDLQTYLSRSSNNKPKPIQQFFVPYLCTCNTMSGMATDGTYIYILASEDKVSAGKSITVISASSGEIVKNIKLSGITSEPDLLKQQREGTDTSPKRFCYMTEAEGLSFYKDSLVFFDKMYMGIGNSFVTYNGGTYVAYDNPGTASPCDISHWIRIDYTPSGTAAWSSSGSYSGMSGKKYNKFFCALAPFGHWPEKENPIRTHERGCESATVSSVDRMSFDSATYAWVFGHRTPSDDFFASMFLLDGDLNIYKSTLLRTQNANIIVGTAFDSLRFTKTDYKNAAIYPCSQYPSSANSTLTIYGNVVPGSSNLFKLGSGSLPWSDAFITTGTHIGSDERIKDEIADVDEALMRAWGKVRFVVFKMRDAIEKKGSSNARIHVGCIAQEILEAFSSEGLDAHRYGLFCYDEWEDEPAVYKTTPVYDEDGKQIGEKEELVKNAVKAGSLYSLRYEECLALECAYLRWRLDHLENIILNR